MIFFSVSTQQYDKPARRGGMAEENGEIKHILNVIVVIFAEEQQQRSELLPVKPWYLWALPRKKLMAE